MLLVGRLSTLGVLPVRGALCGLWRRCVSVHIEADFIVPVDDYQVTDFAAFVIGDLRYLELRTGVALEDFLLTLAFGIEFTVSQFDINERACIKFAADPDVEASTFEAVGRLAFFLFGVALCSDVLFSDPGLFFVVPDVDITEQVSVCLLYTSPSPRDM